MSRKKEPTDILQSFVESVRESIIDPYKKTQAILGMQRELRESKRYAELEVKLRDYCGIHDAFKENFYIRDKVLETLRAIHSGRMSQFLVSGRAMTPEESEELKTALEPYINLLEPAAQVHRLEHTLMSEGKMKKMPLPYDDITTTLNEVKSLVARMPQILMDGVSNLSDSIENVA